MCHQTEIRSFLIFLKTTHFLFIPSFLTSSFPSPLHPPKRKHLCLFWTQILSHGIRVFVLMSPSSVFKSKYSSSRIATIPPQYGILAPYKYWSWACCSPPAPPPVAVDASSLWHSSHSPGAHRAQLRPPETRLWGWREAGWWSRPRSSRHGKGRPLGPAETHGRVGLPLRATGDYLVLSWLWCWPWYLVWSRRNREDRCCS